MSWKPVTQPAADSQPSSSNAVISSKKASLQLLVEKEKQIGPVVGLEYIVEIQSVEVSRNTIFKCILCEYSVDVSNGIKKILDHIQKLTHKLQYLERHFQLIKNQRLVRHKNVTPESVDQILDKVESYFGRLQCHLVIGANNYSANENYVIDIIQSGPHFDENSKFLSYLHKELEEKGNSEGDKGGGDDSQSSLRSSNSEAAERLRSSSVASSHSERRKQDTRECRRGKEKSSERSNHSRRNRGRNRSTDSRRDKSKSPQSRRSSSWRRRLSRSRERRQKRVSRSPKRRGSSRSRERGRKKVSRSPRRRNSSRQREKRQKTDSRSTRRRMPSGSTERRQRRVSTSPRRGRSVTKERSLSSTLSLSQSPEPRRKSPLQRNSGKTSFDLRSKLTVGAGRQEKSPAGRKREKASRSQGPAFGIMGHWGIQRRRKQHRSRSSSKSPEKEKSPLEAEEEEVEEDVIQILEETNSLADEHRRRVRRLQLREEGAALRQLAAEKGSYFNKASSHPKYTEAWNKFWIAKQKKVEAKGIDINSIDLISEWQEEWRKIVEAEYEEKMKSKKAEISEKWNEKLNNPDSLPDPIEEIIILSESEDSEKDRPATPPPPEIFSGLAQTEQEEVKPKRARRYSPPPPEDVQVLSLLNLLIQLKEKNLLSCGERIQQLRELALNKENCEYGSSQELFDNSDCFDLMDSAGEALKLKQTAKMVPEIHLPVVKIVLGQISLFLQKSKCQKSDILEIESFTPIRTDDSNILKMSIRKNIEKEVQRLRKTVTEQEFNSLVEAEYVRAKHDLKPSTIKQQPQPPPQDGNELYSAYSSSIPGPSQPQISSSDWNNILSGVTSIKESENIQNIHSLPSSSPYMRNSIQNFPVEKENKSLEQNDNISDHELVALIKNSDQLGNKERKKLFDLVSDLENVDPMKVKRINKILDHKQS